MTRLLFALFFILSFFALAENRISRHRETQRVRAGALRPLARVAVEQVDEFQIGFGSRQWTYVRRDSVWRYPAYFDAFVQKARVDHLLNGLLRSLCTLVSTEPGDLARFGLTPGQSLRVTLKDGAGRPLLKVAVGRGVPGPRSGEAYVQLAGADSIYHLHANPRLALDNLTHPMIDPHVLPLALERSSIARITYGPDGYPLQALRRKETAPAAPSLPGMPPQGPSYEWIGMFAGEEKVCVNSSAFAYVDFLSRLRYQALHAPRDYVAGGDARVLILEDNEGWIDTLEVGGQSPEGNSFLRHRTTGQVMSIAPKVASLLLPTARTLLDSLPQPSPYQIAEPFSRSLF